jgi:hypothetical protein
MALNNIKKETMAFTCASFYSWNKVTSSVKGILNTIISAGYKVKYQITPTET